MVPTKTVEIGNPKWFDYGTIERTDGNPICAGLYRPSYSYFVPPYYSSIDDYYNWQLYPYVQHTIYNQGTNDIDLLVAQPGTYTLSVTVQGSCGPLTSSTQIDVEDCGSTYSAGSYEYSPNPADGEVTVSLKEEETTFESNEVAQPVAQQQFDVRLFNDKGQPVRQGKSKGRKVVKLNTASLPTGFYYLHILDDKEVVKKQIMIQH